jgi:L-threonylcarbamoyladenylate synthase
MALHVSVNPSFPEDRVLVLAAEVLQAGGVVVYPTETVYGLGANVWNPAAVQKVHALKRRREQKPVLVLVNSMDQVRGLTEEILPSGAILMREFWPGPLTLVFSGGQQVIPELMEGKGTIGIRISSHPVCQKLTAVCGYPVTSTSANLEGEPTPATVEEIEVALGPGVDLYLDAGPLPPSRPSTVVDVTASPPRLIRDGAIPFERLARVLPELVR